MSESDVHGKGDHPLPMFRVDTRWEDWEPDFVTYLGIKNLAKQYHSADPSSAEPRWLPAAESASEFLAAVRDVPNNRALIDGLRYNTAENAITADMLQRWARLVRKNRKLIDAFDEEAAGWESKRNRVFSY